VALAGIRKANLSPSHIETRTVNYVYRSRKLVDGREFMNLQSTLAGDVRMLQDFVESEMAAKPNGNRPGATC
jgi:hypothetical protein